MNCIHCKNQKVQLEDYQLCKRCYGFALPARTA